jgi:hypothetical protein
MTRDMPATDVKVDFVREFVFPFSSPSGRSCVLRAPVCLLNNYSPIELCHQLIQAHKLPCYLQEELQLELEKFLVSELAKCQDEVAQQSIDKITTLSAHKDRVSQMVETWSNAFLNEVRDYASLEPTSDETLFSEIYHSLIHSHSLNSLLSLEHTYSIAIQKLLEERDKNIAFIEHRQEREMEDTVNHVGRHYTDEQINQLTQRHFENLQMVEGRWASELMALQATQRQEYKSWVMKLYEEMQLSGPSTPSYSQTVRSLSQKLVSPFKSLLLTTASAPGSGSGASSGGGSNSQLDIRREESFTVHLGAQLKTTHNLRLVSTDILNFCRHCLHSASREPVLTDIASSSVHRLNTAISLYSSSLSGLLLLVDNRLNLYTGIKREFAKVCEQSTDFHFPNLEEQFETVGRCLVEAKDWRMRKKDVESDKISAKSSTSSASDDRDDSSRGSSRPIAATLLTGDFYVTRHSNLSEVHVVFHLIVDETVSSTSTEITSRHPVILAYRNVLKLCFRHDVRHVTLPLLLVHEMSEEMTIQWCLKRAELVFKCVKGFVMELAMWSGQDSFTIQFVVPKALSDEAFMSVSGMLPTIFRMSNPVVAKS